MIAVADLIDALSDRATTKSEAKRAWAAKHRQDLVCQRISAGLTIYGVQ
jgi:hypothetical protein